MLSLLWIALLALPGWTEFESKLPTTPAPVYNDIAAVPPSAIGSKPILFRDKEGLSPTAQQVWLAFEIKEADYITVLTTTNHDNKEEEQDDDEDKAAMQLLKVQWPDGTIQTDSFAIIDRINEQYSSVSNGYNTQDLFQGVSKAVDNVRCNMKRLNPIFPRNTNQYLQALYMYRKDVLTSLDSHLVALESIDEVLEEYEDGPFLCGDFVSAADCYWAPYLERYIAQLPLTHFDDIVNPRYSGEYVAITEWFNAMEEQIPCYTCRVGGDSVSWENVLREAVANGDVPKIVLPASSSSSSSSLSTPQTNTRRGGGDAAQKQWDQYRQNRPYLCKTPQEECVAYIVRNREAIIDKLLLATNNNKSGGTSTGKSNNKNNGLLSSSMTHNDIDDALREIAFALLLGNNNMEQAASKLSGNARDVAALLNNQLLAPRDMGMLPIAALRNLVAAAPKPRIKAN